MTEQATTANVDQPAWSVEMFAQFWANPDPALVPGVLTEDVVGHWPGRDEPVRGREEYTACIAAIVEALPGMHMEVAEHARNGDFVFVRWILYATGKRGPFELSGMDRIRVRGGQVAENVIVSTQPHSRRARECPCPGAPRGEARARRLGCPHQRSRG